MRKSMIAAAVTPGDALDRRRQVGIAGRDEVSELVDLGRSLGRRLDLDPAADAVENAGRIEGIGRGRCHLMSSG